MSLLGSSLLGTSALRRAGKQVLGKDLVRAHRTIGNAGRASGAYGLGCCARG
jgi:hypothetical protein